MTTNFFGFQFSEPKIVATYFFFIENIVVKIICRIIIEKNVLVKNYLKKIKIVCIIYIYM